MKLVWDTGAPAASPFPPLMSLPVLHPVLIPGDKGSPLALPGGSAPWSGGVILGTALGRVVCSGKKDEQEAHLGRD